MILRPYRRIRELTTEVELLRRMLDDERRADLRDAISLALSMHERLGQQREELDGYDEALRLLSEASWARRGVGS
jgi:hypothetical protein